jgi:IS5 family transposase
MREIIHQQLQLGEQEIGAIKLDPRSRDDIPQILRGLQHIYTTPAIRERVFAILEDVIPVSSVEGETGQSDPNNGRPGMAQWTILVLGVLRLGLNADFDRIQELANQHNTIRQMLGHSDWEDETHYALQTLRDNLRLFTPEILDRINQEVVGAGLQALKKSPENVEGALNGRCDSFVVETDVHFPTDINLLLDAIRKTIDSAAELANQNGLSGWRQSAHHQRQFKNQYRLIQGLKYSTSRDPKKKELRAQEIHDAYHQYLQMAESHLTRAELPRQQSPEHCPVSMPLLRELDDFTMHARRQIDQIERRVLQGEVIPHAEKCFSIFEPHTEWISKGKAGVPVELGLRVCVMEERGGFILHHQVMEKTTDDKVAVAMVDETQQRFPTLATVSMDKGFHSPANQLALKERLEKVVLPKKGRLSKADKAREFDAEFIELRHQHSAVESAINALECHGLDKCRDHGIEGFKRYVAMAVVARNVQRLGAVLRQQEREAEERKRGPYKKAA